VLLIDDVVTTGASFYEAAKTPQGTVSGSVRGLVLTRVVRHEM
jgi:predicted amidophosphoribosyltransferase